ncbi:hypothetical protein BDV19DRAFT_391283 [Aspergillus venezuelensis]
MVAAAATSLAGLQWLLNEWPADIDLNHIWKASWKLDHDYAQGNVNSSIVLHQAGQVVAPQGGIGIMLNLIASGNVHPGDIVSAVIGIEDAPDYYARFNRREETKVVIEFPF